MPNPVPLATKEEEDRRAWVTAHHEVVQLIKDCFGDRFSNNEIFDRLKISRRTGYRALRHDERIGKAPGRKPKIAEETITQMIDYIESGGCNDVGNVWKHLADKFAPDCNPKTVQDAVKKRGFHNHQDTVKLEPLLNQILPADVSAPEDEDTEPPLTTLTSDPHRSPSHDEGGPSQNAQELTAEQRDVLDPSFQQQMSSTAIEGAIDNMPEFHARYVLKLICNRVPGAMQILTNYFFDSTDFIQPSVPTSIPTMTSSQATDGFQPQMGSFDSQPRRQRLAICRRCQQPYDRVENTMENRQCLYHKGSPQKISPNVNGTLEEAPEAFIWSCCGGNGNVRGCCRAMHTTKKKRKYGRKRDAGEAGLDMHNDETGEDGLLDDTELDDAHIDAALQGLPLPDNISSELLMQQMAALSSSDTSMGHLEMQHGIPVHIRSPQLSADLLQQLTSGSD